MTNVFVLWVWLRGQLAPDIAPALPGVVPPTNAQSHYVDVATETTAAEVPTDVVPNSTDAELNQRCSWSHRVLYRNVPVKG